MPSQQRLNSLNITKLKNLVSLDEIRFDAHPVTAILGPNGCGKSTILYALACSYKPNPAIYRKDWKFSYFFLPTVDATWRGSAFKLTHSYREGREVHENQSVKFSKQSDRWAPRYITRPERHVEFIGIETCVPAIESETALSHLAYETSDQPGDAARLVLENARIIFNRQYTGYTRNITVGRRSYAGLRINNAHYSALSMGAGEQRVLYVLHTIFSAPDYSLILIDEIDLLLHTDALRKLLKIISDRAALRHLQIVFTTHREVVLEFESILSIRHIYTAGTKTLCFNETKPDALHRLTGTQTRPLELFVEDDVAQTIVQKVSSTLGVRKYVNVSRYGAATNAFTLLAGFALKNDLLPTMAIFLDGDVYRTDEEKSAQLEKVLSGNVGGVIQQRLRALSHLFQLVLPEDVNPEAYLHQMISSQRIEVTTPNEVAEIINIALDIQAVGHPHEFVNKMIQRLGDDRAVALAKIVNVASLSPLWQDFTQAVQTWLLGHRDSVVEPV